MDVLGAFGEVASFQTTQSDRDRNVTRMLAKLEGAQARFDAEPCARTAWDLRSHWESLRHEASHPRVSDQVRDSTYPASDKAMESVLAFEAKKD